MTRAAILCPGRGSYTEASLGSLPDGDRWVQAAEALRAELGLESLLELDRAARFEPARHLAPTNVAALIYVVSMLDGRAARERHDAVCVGGNSMGWYTALALAGALSFEDGFRLVQGMAQLQEEVGGGGQVIYPVVDDDWRRSRTAEDAVAHALEHDDTFHSIRLGGYEVLAGRPAAVSRLLSELPKVELGKTTYPFRLAQHGPYHTALVAAVAERAPLSFARLEFARPEVTLIDGKGRRFTPWSADVGALRDYTFGDQVVAPYDFTASVRVALHEYAPERVVLPGPGNTLGGVVGQVLVELGWRGVHSRADFESLQAGSTPLVESMRR